MSPALAGGFFITKASGKPKQYATGDHSLKEKNRGVGKEMGETGLQF